MTTDSMLVQSLHEMAVALREAHTALGEPNFQPDGLRLCLELMATAVDELENKTRQRDAWLNDLKGEWIERTFRVLSAEFAREDSDWGGVTIMFEPASNTTARGVLLGVLRRDGQQNYLGVGSTLERALEHAVSKLSPAQLAAHAANIG